MPGPETNGKEVDLSDPVAAYRQLFVVRRADEIPPFIKHIDFKSPPKPDFPHSLHHVETVRNFSRVMAEKCGLDSEWKTAIDIAAKNHDISQGYVTKGKVPIGYHATASALISYMLNGNAKAAYLIDHHDRDIMGTSFEFDDDKDAARAILRDADQLAHSGYSGLIRAAYYWGFRHKLMSSDPNSLLMSMVLCDPRCDNDGLPADHEQKVRPFILREIFPFLIKTRQLDRAINHVRTNFDRFFGAKRPVDNFLDQISDDPVTLEKIRSGKLKISDVRKRPYSLGGTDPTDIRYSNLFIRKPVHDYVILDTCEKILTLQGNYYSKLDSEQDIMALLESAGKPSRITVYRI